MSTTLFTDHLVTLQQTSTVGEFAAYGERFAETTLEKELTKKLLFADNAIAELQQEIADYKENVQDFSKELSRALYNIDEIAKDGLRSFKLKFEL